ncbi:MAG TPA: 1,4-alpha-glucan branching enzyme, partial [Methylocystis sp.]
MTRISDSADDPWRLGRGEIEAILSARCGDPFKVLGLHETPAGFVIRTFVPGAETVHARTPEGREIAALESVRSDGFFEGLIPGATERFPYVLHARNAGGSWDY